MKKFLIFALLILPVASFGASSVRVLGSGAATPAGGTKTTTTSVAKVTPAKVTAAKPAASSNASNATTSRIGTIRVKPKTTTTTLIYNILKDAGLPFKMEYSFPDLVSTNGRPLRFDFVVFDDDGNIDFIIEYQGKQHYEPSAKFGGTRGFYQ